ncbi:MAG: response regulator transcription factor [Pseudomonadota bacterium]|nr:response regulator transcription factor [Pseudomonadota bacterium]
MRVLLVEDDRMIGEEMERSLRSGAYAVDWIRDGEGAVAALDSHDYAIVLLDLGLPKRDGYSVLAHIRERHDAVPVVIVTARDALEARIRGLDAGADDYVLKPFEMQELLARMRSVLRRRSGLAPVVMDSGMIRLDPATREACCGDVTTTLTGREFSLLQALMVRPGAILSRSELEGRIYGWGEEVESNAVEFLIHALRKKLGSGAIKNVRGIGWMVGKRG